MTARATNSQLMLHAETAADLMMSNPVSLREDASVHDAIVLFTQKGFSAAPVIDVGGRPIGVVSLSDVVIHDRAKMEWGARCGDRFQSEGSAKTAALSQSAVADQDTACVGDLMTPAVFCVSPASPTAAVIQEMLALRVHHLFVVDDDGVLVGVISALDILRHLR